MGNMEAMPHTSDAVAISNMPLDWRPLGRHGEPKEQLFEIRAMVAAVAVRDERARIRFVPLIGPVTFRLVASVCRRTRARV